MPGVRPHSVDTDETMQIEKVFAYFCVAMVFFCFMVVVAFMGYSNAIRENKITKCVIQNQILPSPDVVCGALYREGEL